MNLPELFEKYPFLKTYAIPLGLGCVGLILLGYGLLSSMRSDQSNTDQSSINSRAPIAKPTVSKDIIVDIEGAVQKPGVVHLHSDARVQDALVAAGGMTEIADNNWIQKHLNLAAKLTDGGKMYIPRNGESVAGATTSDTSNSTGLNTSDTVNINTATSSELDALPGIGPTTAQKIITNRPYSDINELTSKKVVNKKVFEQIKEKISL